MAILDLGCGPRSKTPGSVGLDKRPAPHVDVVHDLDEYPYPFDDDQFDHVEMSHVIEHVQRPLHMLGEVHRITRPHGTVRIITPHYSSQLSYGDLEHFHHLGYVTFANLENTGFFRIQRHKLWFTDLYRICGLAWLANRMPRRWEKYHCWLMPAFYVEVWLEVVEPQDGTNEDFVTRYMY